jgi:tryptophan 7-halogenase
MEVFRARGRAVVYEADGFKESNWIAIYNGLGVVPRAYDSLVDRYAPREIRQMLRDRCASVRRGVETMPTHEQFIDRYFRKADADAS